MVTHTCTLYSTLSCRPPAALRSSDGAALPSEHGVYSLSPDLLAALVRHATARLRHLPQGGPVQLACHRKPRQPLEVTAGGECLHDNQV